MTSTSSTRALRSKALQILQQLGLSQTPFEPQPGATSPLSAAECQAKRQLLLLTQAEAAAWLSEPPVSERAWQYWEAGRRPVPEDVALALRDACEQRQRAIEQAQQAIESAPSLRHVGVWYAKASDWRWTLQPAGLPWKMHNSVVAHIAGQGLVKLVGFDETAYLAWSEGRPRVTAAAVIVRHGQWAQSTLAAPAGVVL